MRPLSIFLILMLFVGCKATAQPMHPTQNEQIITISTSATELLPADQIIFNITINAEEESPQLAFNRHKEMETELASMLKEMDIDETNIRFQPVRISKSYRNDRKDQYSQTNQQVQVTFSDFALYEELQIALINTGFNSFNASFSSSKIAEGKNTALKKAIETAKEKASIIAQSAGVRLGGIKSISYGDFSVQPFQELRTSADFSLAKAPSLMDFEQTVAVTANISIEFYIQ